MRLRLTACFWVAAVTTVVAQQPTRIYGVTDGDVPTPRHVQKRASDPSATHVLQEFVQASGLTAWKGLTGKGNVSFAGSDQTLPARLYLRDEGVSRLDIDRTEGLESTVLHATGGYFQISGPRRSSISPELAWFGLVSFPRLLSTSYPTNTTILTDQGIVSIGNRSLHRVTLDDPETATAANANSWTTVDLYFDPETHLLAESVTFVRLSSMDRSFYMVTTGYEDYRADGGATLPHRLIRSLNGNVQWTLQLSELDSNAIPDSSLFSF